MFPWRGFPAENYFANLLANRFQHIFPFQPLLASFTQIGRSIKIIELVLTTIWHCPYWLTLIQEFISYFFHIYIIFYDYIFKFGLWSTRLNFFSIAPLNISRFIRRAILFLESIDFFFMNQMSLMHLKGVCFGP